MPISNIRNPSIPLPTDAIDSLATEIANISVVYIEISANITTIDIRIPETMFSPNVFMNEYDINSVPDMNAIIRNIGSSGVIAQNINEPTIRTSPANSLCLAKVAKM